MCQSLGHISYVRTVGGSPGNPDYESRFFARFDEGVRASGMKDVWGGRVPWGTWGKCLETMYNKTLPGFDEADFADTHYSPQQEYLGVTWATKEKGISTQETRSGS